MYSLVGVFELKAAMLVSREAGYVLVPNSPFIPISFSSTGTSRLLFIVHDRYVLWCLQAVVELKSLSEATL